MKVIVREIDKLALGIKSHLKSLAGGLFELKIDFGQGYRIYFINIDDEIVLLLIGGDKSTQKQDIKNARKLKKCMEVTNGKNS